MAAMEQINMSPGEDQPVRHHGSKKSKGRGHKDIELDDRYEGPSGIFETLDNGVSNKAGGPIKSIEGWVIMITGINRDACEENVMDAFESFGEIKCITLNLDRRTGFVCGYAFLEFEKFSEAKEAIDEMNGSILLEEKISVGWAFIKPPTH